MKVNKTDRAEAVKMIKKFCGQSKTEPERIENPGKPGEYTVRRRRIPKTVFGIVRHVSRSGMSRRIDFYTVYKGELMYLSGYFSHVLGWARHRDGGLIVSGCGMDMIFHSIYSVGQAVWNDGTRLRSQQL